MAAIYRVKLQINQINCWREKWTGGANENGFQYYHAWLKKLWSYRQFLTSRSIKQIHHILLHRTEGRQVRQASEHIYYYYYYIPSNSSAHSEDDDRRARKSNTNETHLLPTISFLSVSLLLFSVRVNFGMSDWVSGLSEWLQWRKGGAFIQDDGTYQVVFLSFYFFKIHFIWNFLLTSNTPWSFSFLFLLHHSVSNIIPWVQGR